MENLEQILNDIYKTSPYLKYRNKTDFKGEQNELYGELTRKGVDGIVNHFKQYFNKDTIFYDLGCGLGKMVLHIGLQYKPKKSCGIEYSKERVQAGFDLKEKYCKENDTISFIGGDFFTKDLSDATIVYVDNTAMSHEMTKKIIDKLPKGCLFICRKEPDFDKFIKVSKDGFKTTYDYKTIYYLIKK